MPGPDILGSSAAVAAYAGLNPQQHQSGISVSRPVRISKIGNAVLRTALYMPALSAMRYNPAVALYFGGPAVRLQRECSILLRRHPVCIKS
jgi:transposase